MAIELETINPEKMIRIMFNHLSKNSGNSASRFKDNNKNMSDEEFRQLLEKEFPQADEVMKELGTIAESNQILNKRVKLSLNKEINRIIITIVEKDTDRVIKEIPCREIQSLAAHLKQAIGILYDDNA